jgi:hypothetical protein
MNCQQTLRLAAPLACPMTAFAGLGLLLRAPRS